MNIPEVVDIIKNSKKYSESELVYLDYSFDYIIGDNKYSISITQESGKIIFNYINYNLSVKDIKVGVLRNVYRTSDSDEKIVLSRFAEMIRYIKKLNFYFTVF